MRKTDFWILILVWGLFAGTAHAQQWEEQKDAINKIKKSALYLYAETTMADKQEALQTAMQLLEKEAQRWVRGKKTADGESTQLVLSNISQTSGKVELPRGNMYRAFVYVKKADVQAARNTRVTQLEQPVDGTDKTGGKVPPSTYEPLDASAQAARTEVLNKLLALKDYAEVPPCLQQLQEEGKITEYKRYAALSNPDEYVLIIYNRDSQVEAVLGEGNPRTNLRTQRPDGVANYKGRGAIGVKLNPLYNKR